jgi:hypothetical protein
MYHIHFYREGNPLCVIAARKDVPMSHILRYVVRAFMPNRLPSAHEPRLRTYATGELYTYSHCVFDVVYHGNLVIVNIYEDDGLMVEICGYNADGEIVRSYGFMDGEEMMNDLLNGTIKQVKRFCTLIYHLNPTVWWDLDK